MVISSEANPTTTAPSAVPIKRQPLKPKRGLSAFYFSKSQSFNCISDLHNPFCQSAIVLSKRSYSQAAWQQPFSSIQEDSRDCDSMQEQQQEGPLDCAAESSQDVSSSPRRLLAAPLLSRHSWDGSSAGTSFGSAPAAAWTCTEAALLQQQQQQQPQVLLEQMGSAATPPGTGCLTTGTCITRGSSPSLCSSSGGDSSSGCYETSADSCCRCGYGTDDDCVCMQEVPTDTLCHALKAASLAARRPQLPPHLQQLCDTGC